QDSLGGLTTSSFDADNRLVSRQFKDGHTQLRLDLTYDGVGNLLTQTRFSDLAGTDPVGFSQYGYDAVNQLTHLRHQDGKGAALDEFQYTYDPGQRLISKTENGVTTNFTYDATSQLTSDGSQALAYDPNGNRTNPGDIIGPDNQLLSDGTWNYSYDGEGNLV